MVVDDHVPVNETIRIFADGHAEILTCCMCGKTYTSRGRYDPGYCYDCEQQMKYQNAPLVGGPLGQ